MPTLYHSLGLGHQGLVVSRQGVDTSGHNIANAQVEGYSRQKVRISQRDPLEKGGNLIGNGVYIKRIERAHDKFIEGQINKANQGFGMSQARSDGLKALELIFSPEQSASISDELSRFFGSLQDLSNFPEDFTVRTNALENAKNLTGAFRSVDTGLKDHRSALDDRVFQKTNELNDKLQEIAGLNVKIRTLETGRGQEANDLRDQRDRLVSEVAKTVDVHYYEDEHGMMLLRGPRETTLVDKGFAGKFGVLHNGDNQNMNDVVITDFAGNATKNITKDIKSGEMAGLLNLRDDIIPHLIGKNDEMAYTLVSRFNEVHREGYGVKNYIDKKGRNFFNSLSQVEGAARDIGLDDAVIQSTDAIAAASSALAPGDNVNVNRLLQVKDENILENNSITMNEFYADYIGVLGLEVVRADNMHEADKILSSDLQTRREAVSGVSLDEEATNLLKWQSNFTASSRVITTVDEMLETVLSLKR
jgi:flagellar hook-associated protein 1 FlgK